LNGIDLDLRHLDVLSGRFLGDGGAAERRGEHRCAVDEKLNRSHDLLPSIGMILRVADRVAPIIGSRYRLPRYFAR
jgi:hypothetical protein